MIISNATDIALATLNQMFWNWYNHDVEGVSCGTPTRCTPIDAAKVVFSWASIDLDMCEWFVFDVSGEVPEPWQKSIRIVAKTNLMINDDIFTNFSP